MSAFGLLKPEQKEEVARRLIPMVNACKTEQEAVLTVAEVIETYK